MPRTKQKKTSEEKEKAPKPPKSPKVPKSPKSEPTTGEAPKSSEAAESPKSEPTTGEAPKSSEVTESPKPELGIEKTPLPSKQAEVEPAKGVSEKIVFVGQKPVKNYVMACITSFSAGSNKIVLKARGRAICKAVDTAELLRRTFMKNAQLQGISISTERVTREGDRKTNVSTIEISITRQ